MALQEKALFREYASEPTPLGGYLTFLGVYAAGVGALLVALARSRRRAPRLGPLDVALLGAATHKLSRMIGRDKVTAPLRAPFTHLDGAAGSGELDEEPRGRGLRWLVGAWLICPFCLDPWVATGLLTAYVLRPREARLVLGGLSAVTVADFLQRAYDRLDTLAPPALRSSPEAEWKTEPHPAGPRADLPA
jgi:hypothetical protein